MTQYKLFCEFLNDIRQNRKIIIDLVKNDFKNRHVGNHLGILWAFIQPTITILIFWFVFQVGFKSAPVDNFPFILWLIAGMIPWFFFSESLQNATNSILSNTFLVKKIVFKVSLLPIIQIISSLIIHLFFIIFSIGIFLFYGYTPTLYWLQLFYYLFASIILILGISWMSSSIIIFFRDFGQIIAMLLQFGFWLTPIFWSIKILPQQYYPFIQANPMYYITEGYRDSFINHIWFWEKSNMSIQFWIFTSIIFIAGTIIFQKLKPHFSDVL